MNERLMWSILNIQSVSRDTTEMTGFIVRRCKEYGATVWTKDGNIYAEKGRGVRPCVVAHTDTVFDILPADQYRVDFHKGMWYAWNPTTGNLTGVGGDDKVGIYVALYALQRLGDIKVAFFRDEELGCLGSRQADMAFFDDAGFVLQCDRRGYGEFVSVAAGTEIHDDEFHDAVAEYLAAYGIKGGVRGSVTDVGELKERGLKVAAANIACGYYNPHTDDEFIVRKDVERAQAFVLRVCRALTGQTFAHEYVPRYGYGARWTQSAGGWAWDEDQWDWRRDHDAKHGVYGTDYTWCANPETRTWERYNLTARGERLNPNGNSRQDYVDIFEYPTDCHPYQDLRDRIDWGDEPTTLVTTNAVAVWEPEMKDFPQWEPTPDEDLDYEEAVYDAKIDRWIVEQELRAVDDLAEAGVTAYHNASGEVIAYRKNGKLTGVPSKTLTHVAKRIWDIGVLQGALRLAQTGQTGDGMCPRCKDFTLMYDDHLDGWFCTGDCQQFTVLAGLGRDADKGWIEIDREG